MRFYGFDWTYLVFILPCVLLSLFCQIKVSSAFSKYSQVPNSRRMTGAQAAEYVLRQNGVYGVRIEHVAGKLTDHFDPRTNVIRLSDAVFAQTSVAAVGVAAHEAGHAVQHAQNYLPNKIRGVLVPVANIGSNLGLPIVVLGLMLGLSQTLCMVGIVMFLFGVLFQIVTLPVEFDASRRGLEMLENYGILGSNELELSKKVLRAAALTYVAAAASSILQLLRLIILTNGRSGRRRD